MALFNINLTVPRSTTKSVCCGVILPDAHDDEDGIEAMIKTVPKYAALSKEVTTVQLLARETMAEIPMILRQCKST
jgi:hypothetical protein